MPRLVIRHEKDDDLKGRWVRAGTKLDADATYAERLDMILTFIEKEDGAVSAIKEANREPRFR